MSPFRGESKVVPIRCTYSTAQIGESELDLVRKCDEDCRWEVFLLARQELVERAIDGRLDVQGPIALCAKFCHGRNSSVSYLAIPLDTKWFLRKPRFGRQNRTAFVFPSYFFFVQVENATNCLPRNSFCTPESHSDSDSKPISMPQVARQAPVFSPESYSPSESQPKSLALQHYHSLPILQKQAFREIARLCHNHISLIPLSEFQDGDTVIAGCLVCKVAAPDSRLAVVVCQGFVVFCARSSMLLSAVLYAYC